MCPQPHAAERTEKRGCVCDVSLSLAPYSRFVSPLKTNSGRSDRDSCGPHKREGAVSRARQWGCAWQHSALRVRAQGAGMYPQWYTERTETRVCVRDVSLSLAPYPSFESQLKTSAGRATSSLLDRWTEILRTTQERRRGGKRISGDARGNIATCACAHKAQLCTPGGMQREQRHACVCTT
jgi:hypothetical protein